MTTLCVLSALLSSSPRGPTVATPLFPHEEKARGPGRVLSKSCFTSAEESGTDTCQETSARFLLESGLDFVVSQMVLGRRNPSEEGTKCKLYYLGAL